MEHRAGGVQYRYLYGAEEEYRNSSYYAFAGRARTARGSFRSGDTTFISIPVSRRRRVAVTVYRYPPPPPKLRWKLREPFDPLNLHKGTPRTGETINQVSAREERGNGYRYREPRSALFEHQNAAGRSVRLDPRLARWFRTLRRIARTTPRWRSIVFSPVSGDSFLALSRARDANVGRQLWGNIQFNLTSFSHRLTLKWRFLSVRSEKFAYMARARTIFKKS